MKKGKYIDINWKLLPLKIHFFLFLGGIGAVEPYKTLVGKSIGIDAASIGVAITISLVLNFLLKPVIGYLVNYYKAMKCFCIGILLTIIISSFFMFFTPNIDYSNTENQTLVSDFNGSSHKEINVDQLNNVSNIASLCSGGNSLATNDLNDRPSEQFADTDCPDVAINMYLTYQFWVFIVALIILHLSASTICYLSDVVCYDILDNNKGQYGRQRLWGTVGLAITCFLAGYLNDLATGDKIQQDYTPGFYVMLVLTAVDVLLFFTLPIHSEKPLGNKSIRDVMGSSEIIIFAVGAVFVGIYTSFLNYFEFWYLQDLGASQTLLGLTTLVQCLFAEVPFFFVSDWFVAKYGCYNGLLLSFAGFGGRFGLYSIITNPWWALAIDLSHGLTYALWHASMTAFAFQNSPEGLEGAIFGLFDGLTYGLGMAIGSSVAGVGIDLLGGQFTVIIFSSAAFSCVLSFFAADRIRVKCTKEKTES